MQREWITLTECISSLYKSVQTDDTGSTDNLAVHL